MVRLSCYQVTGDRLGKTNTRSLLIVPNYINDHLAKQTEGQMSSNWVPLVPFDSVHKNRKSDMK